MMSCKNNLVYGHQLSFWDKIDFMVSTWMELNEIDRDEYQKL